jgi:hypothetical protein
LPSLRLRAIFGMMQRLDLTDNERAVLITALRRLLDFVGCGLCGSSRSRMAFNAWVWGDSDRGSPKRPLPTQDGDGSVGWIIDVPQRFGVGLAQFVRKRARKDGTRENASCRAAVSVPSIRTTPAAVGNGNSRRGKLGQSKW